ncbi:MULTISPECIES: hypothetical protein [Streptomyces]|uniref:Tail assembly chaperone n=1 Tax=Streptomyces dengpaensis TaxID=2049881 RepID=A0ABM6SZ16_9ACTN|nr:MULTISPECIES: hypothetical protein [Streptomyces]AVH60009.1 hypothetical protein C4B68_34225 [Streptomyces dengpaensis]PIB09647.1 hypothetical protein B1C81_10900 [Streptomyces sp. HG99]
MPKAPTTRPAHPHEDEEIFEITTSEPAEQAEERRTLFTIDGEKITVPKVIDERLVFLAMNYMRTEGAWFGTMYLTELILGTPQFKKIVSLLEQRRINQDQFDRISSRVNDLFFQRTKVDDVQGEQGKASPDSPGN